MKKKVVFTKDMGINQALEINPNVRVVFMGFGMNCVGCVFSDSETIEDAARVHDLDVEYLLEKLNELNDDDFDEFNLI